MSYDRLLSKSVLGNLRLLFASTIIVLCHLQCLAVEVEAPLTAQSGMVKSEFVFPIGKAAFSQCHASTIAETKDRLVTAWFGGSGEGHRDVGIWLARFANGRWTAPEEVTIGKAADGSREPCWNPVLFQPTQGSLILFYKVGPSPRKWWG